MLNIILTITVLLFIGYIFGCFSTGFLVGKIYGVDIRQSGSGNVGTTNALRTLGPKAGLLTFIGDILKVLIPTLLIRFVLFQGDSDLTSVSYTHLVQKVRHVYVIWMSCNVKGCRWNSKDCCLLYTSVVHRLSVPWLMELNQFKRLIKL